MKTGGATKYAPCHFAPMAAHFEHTDVDDGAVDNELALEIALHGP